MFDDIYYGCATPLPLPDNAKDYVEMQWRILQQKKADDYVIFIIFFCFRVINFQCEPNLRIYLIYKIS